MNNITTFETAQKLKDAGFQQPLPEVGQVWYDKKSNEIIFLDIFQHYKLGLQIDCIAFYEEETKRISNIDGLIFAPTATDILQELGDNYALFTCTIKGIPNWCCNESSEVLFDGKRYISKLGIITPAEAAALAWLSIHKK